MNKGIIYTENNIIVETDDGLKTRKYSANIEEILETENNIEEINRELSSLPDYDYLESSLPDKILYFFMGTVLTEAIIGAIMALSILPNPLGIAIILSTTVAGSATIVTLYKNSKKALEIQNKYLDKSQEILEKELDKQYDKLNALDNVKDCNKEIPYSRNVTIKRTELMKDLKRKLELITDYLVNKKKYIKFEENGTLSQKLENKEFSDSDISFIQELIKEDTPENENTQKHNKQKVKVAKKN